MENNNEKRKPRLQKVNFNEEEIYIYDDMDVKKLLEIQKAKELESEKSYNNLLEQLEKMKNPKIADYLRSLSFKDLIHYFEKNKVDCLHPLFTTAITDLLGIDEVEYMKKLHENTVMYDIDELLLGDDYHSTERRKK